MAGYFLIGAALLLSFLLLARWVAAVDPRALAKGVRYGGGAAAAGVALYLVASGRWPYLMAALSAAVPLMLRWRALRDHVRSARGPSPGKRSEVETRLLRMTLDHDTGDMVGTAREGPFAGRSLAGLSPAELMALLEYCRGEDAPSATLLETYLDRRLGSDWRERHEGGSGAGAGGEAPGRRSSSTMTRAEALEILGLPEGASREQIKDSYRKLIIKLHPDAGGSAYLAAKLNQAKELLLGE